MSQSTTPPETDVGIGADGADRHLARARARLRADLDLEFLKVSDGWGRRLGADHPGSHTVTRLTRDLLEAGFTIHACAARAPQGGVCLTPLTEGERVIVTWTVHDSLAHDDARWACYEAVQDAMNAVLADVLIASGWAVEPFGHAGAHTVATHDARSGS